MISIVRSLEDQLAFYQVILTNFNRQIFSRKAPMKPMKPRINIIPPTIMKKNAGSLHAFPKKSE